MQNPKSDIWVPDTRPESVSTFTESYTPAGGQEQTATYKAIPNHTIIGGILNKLSFGWGHAKATWYNKLAGKTVKDKFDEVDTAVQDLSANMNGISSPVRIDFTPAEGVDYVNNWIKNDSIIVEGTISIKPGGLSTTIAISGFTYYIMGKIDNGNPFNMIPNSRKSIHSLAVSHLRVSPYYSIYSIQAVNIIYDGVNTYLALDSDYKITGEDYINTVIIPLFPILENTKPN